MHQRSWSRARAIVLAALSSAPFAFTALGADRTWANSNGGTFTTAGNWLGGVVPGPTDRAVFPGNAYVISFPVSVATDRLLVTADRTTLALGGHSYLLNNAVIDSVDV